MRISDWSSDVCSSDLGPTNAWFVGGSPDLIAGLYIGYDQPQNLGGHIQGSNTAVPVWKQWAEVAMKDRPKTPFVAPSGIRMVRIERRTGRKVFGVWQIGRASCRERVCQYV